MLREEANIL